MEQRKADSSREARSSLSHLRYGEDVTAAEHVWLVAGGEPGASRFGRLIQRQRKEQGLSVESVAARSGLSVGTIRAIEQGRRAPSEDSGMRLLRVLLPEGLARDPRDEERVPLSDRSFIDPETGAQVTLVFGAKTAGDNRRWSSDKGRDLESRAEAALRDMLNDPIRREAWAETFRQLGRVFDEVKTRSELPPSDEELGAAVRRITTLKALRIWYLNTLLELWRRVDSGESREDERHLDEQILKRLTTITYLDEEPET